MSVMQCAKNVRFDKKKLRLEQYVDLLELRSSRFYDDQFLDEANRRLRKSLTLGFWETMATRIKVDTTYPKTWWDAFKDRWFPSWLKERYPVEWTKVEVDEPQYVVVLGLDDIQFWGDHAVISFVDLNDIREVRHGER